MSFLRNTYISLRANCELESAMFFGSIICAQLNNASCSMFATRRLDLFSFVVYVGFQFVTPKIEMVCVCGVCMWSWVDSLANWEIHNIYVDLRWVELNNEYVELLNLNQDQRPPFEREQMHAYFTMYIYNWANYISSLIIKIF